MIRFNFFIFSILSLFLCPKLGFSQSSQNLVAYAGGTGRETFFDIAQLSDSTFLVAGEADDLNWISAAVPWQELAASGIKNGLGTGRYGLLLQLSSDFKTIKRAVHFPKGAVERIRFIKMTSRAAASTGQIYLSGTTEDTKANEGGYFLAKLNGNFLNGSAVSIAWAVNVWAEGDVKANQPWDVDASGRVYFIGGQNHAFDWSMVTSLDANGKRRVVENWRNHWKVNGGEWRGTPASASPNALEYSGIVLKFQGRCDLRSWSTADYQYWQKDENGGTKRGRWPMDFLFNGPCDPAAPTSTSGGYTGYTTSGTPVYGGSAVCIDRRNGDVFIGMNTKAVLPTGEPDFEPAVIAYDSSGALKWWSRLYHEVQPDADTVNSSPDQYIDGLAIDYALNRLVVNARCHGNNVENLWEGNLIAANTAASGFQNQFTGSSGNIHISWLGKLDLQDGTLQNATYVAEYAEGATGLSTPLSEPNLDGWPNPNAGWPTLNTTRLVKNTIKTTQNGEVLILGSGRRTMTTANAFQKMPKPGGAAKSAWNAFVRVYAPDFSVPKYSSILVGKWDTLTQAGGDNTELFGAWKTVDGVVVVGRQKALNGLALGANIPTANVPAWASQVPSNESAVIAFLPANNLKNPLDGPFNASTYTENLTEDGGKYSLFPNPTDGPFYVKNADGELVVFERLEIRNALGQIVRTFGATQNPSLSGLPSGLYWVVGKLKGGGLVVLKAGGL
jgi:hypothetical protein